VALEPSDATEAVADAPTRELAADAEALGLGGRTGGASSCRRFVDDDDGAGSGGSLALPPGFATQDGLTQVSGRASWRSAPAPGANRQGLRLQWPDFQ